jgi:tetratricopeptide (TPR) repeat protein
MRQPTLMLILLLTVCGSLATYIEPRAPSLDRPRAQSAGLLETLMGDSRRLFATHFLLKADAYFHSGYYPGIFDSGKSFEESHIAAESDDDPGHTGEEHGKKGEEAHDHAEQAEAEAGFGGAPRDWIDRFSRHFYPSTHTHLDDDVPATPGSPPQKGGLNVREILPWLKLSAELDPQRIETYVVGAYWLRSRLGKAKEAEEFLRDGLRENPGNPALLLELGKIHSESANGSDSARNLWNLAIRKWQEIEAPRKEPDKLLLGQIASHLAKLEENSGNLDRALACWTLVKRVSPRPQLVEKRIAEIQARQAAQRSPNPPAK